MRWLWATLFVLLAPVMVPAGMAAATEGLEVETFTLRNGMDVVVIPDNRAPIVTHMVWYRVGSADEPRGLSGIAHFLEHLLFKRTRKLDVGEFSTIVAENGGQHNAFTSYDVTAYYQNVAADRLGLMMELEAERMVNLELHPDDVASEREVIIEERRLRTDNNPGALLGEQMMAALFLAHPYGIPVIGWMHEMQALDLQSTREFYDQHYAPGNAILVVAGDVTAAEVRRQAERTYGRIRGRKAEPRVRTQEPPAVAARRVVLEDERVRQPSWQRLYRAPRYEAGKGGEAEALAVLAELLGSGTASRLYRRLVIETELATDAGAWFQGTAYDYGRFGLYASPVPETDPEGARARLEGIEREVDALLEELLESGLDDAEFARAKARLLAAEIYSRDSITTLARIFGMALTAGLGVEDVLAWTDRIEAVTREDVMAAAASVLESRNSVTGLLLPKSGPDDGMDGEEAE